jgi:tRNA-splicing ligase RtcB
MTNDAAAKVTKWLSEPLPTEVSQALDRLAQTDDVCHVAVMPDVHLAGEVCNGTVIATRELIYPQAVGSDIGCGMLAVACDLPADVLANELTAARVLAGLYEHVPANKHPGSRVPEQLPDELMRHDLSSPSLVKLKSRDGLYQLGSLGRGNHFVEFRSDLQGRLWLMLHSGSRAMGQAISEHHLHQAELSASGLSFLDASHPDGLAYLSDLNWAIEYAVQNRLAMARAVEWLMQTLFATEFDWTSLIHCHHNHVQREVHFGQELWIHRKGALPAAESQAGVIPGSMGSRSYHVTGRGLPESLQSSSHGAGRAIARQAARQRISRRDLQQQMRGVWFNQRQVDSLRDEAPSAYKEIGRVMRAQRDLTRIIRELKPLLVYKGS